MQRMRRLTEILKTKMAVETNFFTELKIKFKKIFTSPCTLPFKHASTSCPLCSEDRPVQPIIVRSYSTVTSEERPSSLTAHVKVHC